MTDIITECSLNYGNCLGGPENFTCD